MTIGVVSWIMDIGSKGYPLFRFGMGREGGWEMSSAGGTPSKPKIYVRVSTAETQGVYLGSGRPEANSPTSGLSGISWCSFTEVVAGANPGGVG